jgi:hypothetical protein
MKFYNTQALPALLYSSENWTIKGRDEIYGDKKKSGYTWADYKTNINCKGVNLTVILDKIQEYRRNRFQRINRMPCNILVGIMKNCRPKDKKKPQETIKETSRSVRLEQVNKWPNCMLAT